MKNWLYGSIAQQQNIRCDKSKLDHETEITHK